MPKNQSETFSPVIGVGKDLENQCTPQQYTYTQTTQLLDMSGIHLYVTLVSFTLLIPIASSGKKDCTVYFVQKSHFDSPIGL